LPEDRDPFAFAAGSTSRNLKHDGALLPRNLCGAEWSMSRRELFGSHAKECLHLAETEKSDELWSILMTMAHAWHRLAQQFDMHAEPPVRPGT